MKHTNRIENILNMFGLKIKKGFVTAPLMQEGWQTPRGNTWYLLPNGQYKLFVFFNSYTLV